MQRPPWWFTAIAIVTALPCLALPWLFAGRPDTLSRYLSMFYPFITILAAITAYRCYGLDRKEMAWILIAVAWMANILIHFL